MYIEITENELAALRSLLEKINAQDHTQKKMNQNGFEKMGL